MKKEFLISYRRIRILGFIIVAAALPAQAQRFLPDDPILKDPDNLPINEPARISLSITYDTLQNTFGVEEGRELLHAQNTNTLGEVPDSSWFTNRIGTRGMTPAELALGANRTGGPDPNAPWTILGAGLSSITEGIIVQDRRGDRYYLIFDPVGLAGMATGAAVVTNKFFYAAGYNVLPASIASFDPQKTNLSPDARVHLLGYEEAPMDREFVALFLREKQQSDDGTYRVAAYQLPAAESVGEFKFSGTRSDDPNDVIPHEDRRELRGLGVFAAWFNHYHYRAINTLDFHETIAGSSYLRHYLVDFSTSLGSGQDLDGRIVPKDKQSGNEYVVWGDTGATIKTALSFGLWKRPWMNVDYPYPKYSEIGRFEGDFFRPQEWKPAYPNAAYNRMLPDDAFWAAKIVARFSDEAIRAIVGTGRYSDPVAERYLADTLIKRRDKIIAAYFGQINPLDGFVVKDGILEFRNLGQEANLAQDSYYEYVIHSFDNQKNESTPLTDRSLANTTQILLPKDTGDYVLVRIRTRSAKQPNWRKNVDVFLRMTGTPSVIGIDREIGAYSLDRDASGRLVARKDIELGGSYQGLNDEQLRLVDDWFRRFNELTNRQVSPEEGYNNLPLSARTTFEAVTNALTQTELTDHSGKHLGFALDLVARIDSVHGAIHGTGGDQQFRIYVQLIPDARKILEESQQYVREHDNTIYHKGYPLSYRQLNGPPSSQFSISLDAMRADIDVDYRSSKMPKALLNGHLTSGNSDVRAGNNYSLHANRWQGFVNWWRGLFGLPFITEIASALDPGKTLIPANPRKANRDLTEAVEDWLQAWLIDNKPEEAVAYLDPSSYHCMQIWSEDNPIDYGVAPLMLLDALAAANQAIGKVDDLSQVVQPETLKNPRLKLMKHKYDDLFVLYDAPEDLALEFDCAHRNDPQAEQPATVSQEYGKYFGSTLRLKTPTGKKGGRMIFLWKRENKKWRIVSYMVDPGVSELAEIPDTRATKDFVIQRMQADPLLLSTVGGFFKQWGSGNIDKALEYFSFQSLPCVALNLEGNLPERDESARNRLKQGMERVYHAFTKAGDMEEFMQPVEFTHPNIRTIDHAMNNRLALAGLPDNMGTALSCDKPLGDVTFDSSDVEVYGKYYATAFKLRLTGQDPAALYLLWAKEEAVWKIVGFYVLTA